MATQGEEPLVFSSSCVEGGLECPINVISSDSPIEIKFNIETTMEFKTILNNKLVDRQETLK